MLWHCETKQVFPDTSEGIQGATLLLAVCCWCFLFLFPSPAFTPVTRATRPFVPPPFFPAPAVVCSLVVAFADALAAGANVLWANTVLHSQHPLCDIAQLAAASAPDGQVPRVVASQDPRRVEEFDDKLATNALLRRGGLSVAQGHVVETSHAVGASGGGGAHADTLLQGMRLPVVVKPVRGRGSAGVGVVHTVAELVEAVDALRRGEKGVDNPQRFVAMVSPDLTTIGGSYVCASNWEFGGMSWCAITHASLFVRVVWACCVGVGSHVIVEEFLSGREVTVAVMPPARLQDEEGHSAPVPGDHWCLPPMERFNHVDGVAPYNGVVAVTHNSRVLSGWQDSPACQDMLRDCAAAAAMVGAAAPIRIDCRELYPGGTYGAQG